MVNSVWVTYSQAVLTPIAKPAAVVVDYAATDKSLMLSNFFTIDKGATPTLTCTKTVLPVSLPSYSGPRWINGDITSTTSKLTIVTQEPSSGTNQLGVGQSVSVALSCTYASATGTVPLAVKSNTLLVTINKAPSSTKNTTPIPPKVAPVIAN